MPELRQYAPAEGKLVNKWWTFVGSSVIMIHGGISYCFSIYAPELKAHFSLSQTQLQELGFAVNLGGYFAILPGHVYSTFSDSYRLGPRLVVWMGCLSCFVGYFGLYLCTTGRLAASFWQLLVFCFVAGNCGTWFDTAGLVTNVRNFPRDRGTTVGLLKSFLGLAGSVYSSLYLAAFAPSVPPFLLFLALGGPLLCLAASAVLNHVPFVEAGEVHPPSAWLSTRGRFLMLYSVVAAVALYQMTSTLLAFTGHIDRDDRKIIFSGLVLLLTSSVVACLKTGGWRSMPAPLPGFLAPPRGDPHAHTSRSSSFNIERHQDAHPPPRDPNSSLVHRRNDPSPRPPQLPACFLSPSAAPDTASPTSATPSRLPSPSLSPRPTSDTQPLLAPPTRPSTTSPAPTATRVQPPRPASIRESSPHHPRRRNGGALLGSNPDMPADADEDDKEDEAVLSLPLLLRNNPTTDEEEAAIEATAAELDTWAAAGTPAFWLLFLQFFCGIGAGLTFLNNLAEIVVALGGAPGSHVVFVSVLSVANALGRLAMGLVPEQELHRRGTPRTAFMVVASALAMVACLVMANARLGGLYMSAIMFGLSFGAHWTLVPAVASDLFGLKYFASNYSVLQLAPALGGYSMATALAGWNYDWQARKQGSSSSTCTGALCYQATFLVLAGICCVSTLGTGYLWLSTRQEYQRISQLMAAVEEVLHEEAGEADKR